MLSFIRICDNSTRKQNMGKICNLAIFISKIKKKLKTRSIKTKRPLVEHKTVTDSYLYPARNQFLSVFTQTVPEFERTKIKYSRYSKNN